MTFQKRDDCPNCGTAGEAWHYELQWCEVCIYTRAEIEQHCYHRLLDDVTRLWASFKSSEYATTPKLAGYMRASIEDQLNGMAQAAACLYHADLAGELVCLKRVALARDFDFENPLKRVSGQ